MEYRKLGKSGLDVGVIGLGTEHIEKKKETMEAILRTAVEAGVNYIDLLYTAPDYWEQYGALFKAYRDKLVCAVHWNAADCHDAAPSQRNFDNILKHLGNDHAEVGLITMIESEKDWKGWAQEFIEHLQRYKEQGRIDAIGMSGHSASAALTVVSSGLIDVLMFPINMLGHDHEDEKLLRQACVERGVGLVAMKPYHGSTLFFVEGRPSGITAAHCLSYVFSLPVSTAVPGPKNVAELCSTLHYLEATEEEKDYRSILANLPHIMAGQCVYCHHCLPCPEGIEIGWLIWLLDYARGGVTDELKGWYAGHKVKASACTECGECVERCPFDVDILAKMRRAVELFEAPR